MLASGPAVSGPGRGPDCRSSFRKFSAASNNLLHPRYVGHQCTTALPLAALGGLVGSSSTNASAIYEMGPSTWPWSG
jgi:hypothetical protein